MSRHLHIGVDPGLRGGIAILEGKRSVPAVLVPMPIVKPGNRGRDHYAVPEIVTLMRRARATGECQAFVERLHPLPPKIAPGAIANYNRGAAYWFFVGVFGALRIPLEPVLPKAWQRFMLDGTPATANTKQRAIIAAQQLFPGVSLVPKGARKPHDGLADALLIAEFGRRRSARVWSDDAA